LIQIGVIEQGYYEPGRMAPTVIPTFLILKSDTTLRNGVGIVENENGTFKATIVLAKALSLRDFP
jgi:hypothetical protein